MKKVVYINVTDSDVVSIDGQQFSERRNVLRYLIELTAKNLDYEIIIDISNAESAFRGIGQVIYDTQKAEIPVQNLLFKKDDGSLLNYEQMRSLNP